VAGFVIIGAGFAIPESGLELPNPGFTAAVFASASESLFAME
jgi:hypothetical protein